MRFYVRNLGPIKKAEFDLANFNIVTGKNHTGKTYLSYSIYSFLKYWKKFAPRLEIDEQIVEFKQTGFLKIDLSFIFEEIWKNFSVIQQKFNENLYSFFGAEPEYFKKTYIEFDFEEIKKHKFDFNFYSNLKKGEINVLEVEKLKNEQFVTFKKIEETESDIPEKLVEDYINDILYEIFRLAFFPNPYIITAERTGIHLFQRELDINRNVFFEKFSEMKEFDLLQFLEEVSKRYTRPIRDNIFRARSKDILSQRKSFYSKEYPEIIDFAMKKIFKVSYKLIDEQFYTVTPNNNTEVTLPLFLSSTSSRSLLDLYIYLKFSATHNDLLIIDEPELNLHPELQINLIQVLALLSNYNTKILISTHSDYILKEVNNLILLSNEFEDKSQFMRQFKYHPKSILKPKDVRVYIAENQGLSVVEIDKQGMERTTFDEAIDRINLISDYLYSKLYDYEERNIDQNS